MRNKHIRILSLLLTVCMVVSMFSVSALAVTSESNISGWFSSFPDGFFAKDDSNIRLRNAVVAEPRAFNANLAFSYFFEPANTEYFPAGSDFLLDYRLIWGRIDNMTVGEFVTGSSYYFKSFSEYPEVYDVSIYGCKDDSMTELYDGAPHDNFQYSFRSFEEYDSIYVLIRYLEVDTFASEVLQVEEGDLLLVRTSYDTSFSFDSDSSASISIVDSKIAALSAEFQAHKDEVAAELEEIAYQLDQIGATQDQIETYLSQIVTELNGFGTDIDTALAYLNGISQNSATIVTALNTIQTKIDTTNSKLTNTIDLLFSMDTSLDTLVQYLDTVDNYLTNIETNTEETNDWLYAIYDTLDVMLDDNSSAFEYLDNMDNSLTFISDSISRLEELTGTSNESLREVVSYLVSIDATGASAASYLQNINTNIADIEDDTSAMLELIESSNEKITAIHSILGQFITNVIPSQLSQIVNNLVSQGTSLESVLSLLETISESSSTTAANTTTMTSQLETLLESLEQVEIDNTERNERLAAIEELLKDFEINIQQSVDKIYTDSDKEGLSGILSNVVSRLSSLINFCGDVFGNMLTAIPDLIGGFNESLSFWGTEEVYEYSPYQIAYYSDSSGADYTNSNSAVQALFTEAERYLGYPYVWGGASPETSFDCSGYISYVLDNSGVYPTSRLTAQGLYNISTPIDPSEAMPGDLIFFTGTYDTSDTVTHVGFYAGDGQMLHCGDPIQYTSCETAYWTTHFYAYGRLPYNDVSNSAAETEG